MTGAVRSFCLHHPSPLSEEPLQALEQEGSPSLDRTADTFARPTAATVPRCAAGRLSEGGYQQQYSSASSGSLYNQVRQAINMGDIGRAEQLLRGAASQDAEWHFLTGSIAYRKGWLDEATQHFQMACNMDPANGEYRQALMMMRQGGQAYRPYGYGGGIDACDCCTACLCMNMCCGN